MLLLMLDNKKVTFNKGPFKIWAKLQLKRKDINKICLNCQIKNQKFCLNNFFYLKVVFGKHHKGTSERVPPSKVKYKHNCKSFLISITIEYFFTFIYVCLLLRNFKKEKIRQLLIAIAVNVIMFQRSYLLNIAAEHFIKTG